MTHIDLNFNNRAWFKKLPNKMGKKIQLTAIVGLMHEPLPIIVSENYDLLVKNWCGRSIEIKAMLHIPTPHIQSWDLIQKKYITMRAPVIITWRCIPKDDGPSHLPTIVGKKHKLALIGFARTGLDKETDCDFPEDLLRNCLTHASLKTKGKYADNIPLLPEKLLAQHTTTVEPITGETRVLVRHPILMPF